MRESWFPYVGACLESVLGGNHFRIWQQGNTSAWFLAASKEVDVRGNHKASLLSCFENDLRFWY